MDSDYDRYDEEQSNQESEWYLGEPSNVPERDVLEYASPLTNIVVSEWRDEQSCNDGVIAIDPTEDFIEMEFIGGPIDGLIGSVEDIGSYRLQIGDVMYCYGRDGNKSVLLGVYAIED